LGKTAPENPPVSLNLLFPEDSVANDFDEDLAEELDEFFHFMIWNDLSSLMILMTMMMTDINLKYPIIE
jgi:hypothetical protein